MLSFHISSSRLPFPPSPVLFSISGYYLSRRQQQSEFLYSTRDGPFEPYLPHPAASILPLPHVASHRHRINYPLTAPEQIIGPVRAPCPADWSASFSAPAFHVHLLAPGSHPDRPACPSHSDAVPISLPRLGVFLHLRFARQRRIYFRVCRDVVPRHFPAAQRCRGQSPQHRRRFHHR